MSMQDLVNNSQAEKALDLTNITADGDTTTASIDRLGFLSLTFMVTFETNTLDGTVDFIVQASDDNVTFEDVPAVISGEDQTPSGYTLKPDALDAAGSAGNVARVGYIGVKRYARLVARVAGVTAGAADISVMAIKGDTQDAGQLTNP